jgi:RNA polymerase sigma factor (sigma-70 family)
MATLPSPVGSDPPAPAAGSDAALIDASRHRPQAFAAIFDRHADELYRYLAGRVGAQVAADLVAEVFVVAFRARDRYDPDRPDARPWLYGIATRLVAQHRRDERRRLRALARMAAPGAVDGFEEHATDRVMAQQLQPRLAGALRRLPAQDRDLLLLVAWGDLTYQRAGQVLGIPVGTVASRLHRIRRKLRRALGDTDPAGGAAHG